MANARERQYDIGVDFDGVVGDYVQLKAMAIRELFGITVLPDALGYGAPPILNAEQRDTLYEALHRQTEWSLRMVPLPGAIQTISRFIGEGHQVRVVTSRDPESTALASEWLRYHGLQVAITGTNKRPKTDATLGLDIFVDDNIGKLLPLQHIPVRMLMHQPHNARVILPERVRRAYGWADVYEKVGALLVARA